MKLIPENREEFERLGIINWRDKGYNGETVKIATVEKTRSDLPFFDGKVYCPFGESDRLNTHAQKTTDVLHQIAPGAEIYSLPCTMNSSDTSDFERILKYMLANDIYILTASVGGINSEKINRVVRKYKEKGIVFFTSAGNSGEDGLGAYAKSDEWISIGALHRNKGEDILAGYSSRGEEIDLVGYSNLKVYNAKDINKTMYMQGTSFSNPCDVGLIALLQQFVKEKIGRFLYQDEIELFIADNCIDMGVEGHDEKYGWGKLILKDPKEMNLKKYLLRGSDGMKFKDIEEGRWSEKAIDFVSDKGIMVGFPDDTFRPTENVTREQMAEMLYRLYVEMGDK